MGRGRQLHHGDGAAYREALLNNDRKRTRHGISSAARLSGLKRIHPFRQSSFPIVTALVDMARQRGDRQSACTEGMCLRRWHPSERFPPPIRRAPCAGSRELEGAGGGCGQTDSRACGGGHDAGRRDCSHAAVVEGRRAKADSQRARPGLLFTWKGQVVAYKRPVADPSEFALDVIDIITHRKRAVRTWNAPAVIALATGEKLVHLVNYGSPIDMDVQTRVQGHFTKATLMRPDADPFRYRRRSAEQRPRCKYLR